MKGILLAMVLLLPIPAASQETHDFEFVSIAGNRIAWSCEGKGLPTIVLIAGMGLDAHASFSRIYHHYDGPGRICMYDRAGMGESTFVRPKTRTLEQLVGELHELESRNGWDELVLVGHSFGGFIARAFAAQHPDEVSAVLFLDSPHEDWLPRLQSEMSEADFAIMERILEWSTKKFHEDYVEASAAVPGMKLEADLPITVVSRGIPHVQIRLERMSYRGIDIFDGEHNVLQAKIAQLTSNSRHRIARYSSHVIDDFDPWLAIEEIRLLIDRIP